MENRSNRLSDIEWATGWRGLWKNLGHPVESIEQKGWWDFIASEVIPFSVNRESSQYWPNYLNHLIGGGMSYRRMREWYTWHGVPYARPAAVVTLTVYHLLNETVEMHNRTGWRADPVADVYIFDTAGIFVFSSDRVCRFFSRTLHLEDWSFQPLYDPVTGSLENVGQNYMVRFGLRRTAPWSLFYHWGNGGELGLSRDLGGGRHVSLGGGFVAKSLTDADAYSETVDLVTSAGLFYDREGSLLAGLLYSPRRDGRVRLNLYPGLLRVGSLRPGFTIILTDESDVLTGITFGSVPLIPVGPGGKPFG